MLVIVLEECPEKSTQPVPFVDRFVLNIEHFMCEFRKLLNKLIQIFIFSFLLEELILRVTFFGDTLKKMPHVSLLLEYFPDNINMLACEIFTGIRQLSMEVEELGFQLVQFALAGHLHGTAIETQPFGEGLGELGHDYFDGGFGYFLVEGWQGQS